MNTKFKGNKQAGFSLIELLIVIVIIGIIAAIAIPNLLASRRSANGASAIQTLRVLSQTEATYASGVGNKEYGTPMDLLNGGYIDSVVVAACGVPPTPKSGYFIQANILTSAMVGGPDYSFSMQPVGGATANRGGDRSFYVDASGVIRVASVLGPPADATSSPLNQ